MAVKISITGIPGVARSLDKLRDDLKDRAASAALNKTVAKAKAEMTRAITDEYNLKRDVVAPRMRVSQASRNKLEVVLDPFASGARGRSLNLIHFLDRKATAAEARRRLRAGKKATAKIGGRELPVLMFKIKKGGPSVIIPGTFLGNDGRTVFMRVGKSRLPIKAVSTIGVPQMFNSRKINKRVMDRIRQELPIEMERAIKMVTERFGK